MKENINLEKTLTEVFPERESGYAYEDLNDVTKVYIKKSMLEFGNQLLQLAAKNVLEVDYIEQSMDKDVYSQILNTIKQVE